MLRRNVASQVVYLPALKLTADGTAVTSGASLTVAKDGTEAACAGALAHAAGGVWKYTPTQSETDCAILALILTATAADPVVLNLVTTGANTAAAAFGAAVAGDSMTLADGAISEGKISAGAFTAAKFAANALDSVWSAGSRTLTGFGTLVADVWAHATRTITGGTVTTVSDKTGYALTSGERDAIAAVIEAEVLNDATGGAVVATIANAVAAYFDNAGTDIPPQVIATAVRNALATELARLDVAVSTRLEATSYTAPDNAGISAAAASAATAASQATTAATQASTAATQATTAATQSTTAANRLGAWTGSGINTVLGAIRAIAAKAAGLTPTDLSDGTTFNNVTDSLEAAAETGGSLTPEQQAQLDLIESKVATLTAGRRPQVVSPVSEGGELVLIAGADYLASADSVISLDIDDVGGAIRTYLQGADVDSVQLSVARAQDVNTVIGTIDPDEIQYASNVTTIQIEIDGDDTVNVYPAEDYEYHILAITNDAKEVVKVTGNCCIRRQRGTASS